MTTLASATLLKQPALASQPHLLSQPAKPKLEDASAPAILSIGFRPFFLLATLGALLWVPLWLLLLSGTGSALGIARSSHMPATILHAHEMLFGFAVAVIAGFLLTAGANWAGRPTTTGKSLALLVGLFLAGRFCLLTNALPPLYVALIDVAFLPVLGATLLVPLIQSGSTRNFQFVVMLLVLTAANALMHAGTSPEFVELTGLTSQTGSTLALRAITLMILVMGGRVIPLFTRNATKQLNIEQRPWVDHLAIGAFLLAAVLDLFLGATKLVGVLFLLASGTHFLRMSTWGTRRAKAPLLWILHAGYGAVALSLALEGLAAWGLLSKTAALHLLTVGGISGLCLGMMTRVSLGHSGRMLSAPRTMSVAFALLMGAAFVRVLGPVFTPFWLTGSYYVSGALFTAAFALLLHFGVPIWFFPRVDERPRSL